MRVNRREFVAASAAALLPLSMPREAAARQSRRLILVAHGLSVIVVGRPKTAKDMPSSSPRVDLLYLDNAAHKVPKFIVGTEEIDLAKAELKILVDGKELSKGPVTLTKKSMADGKCPRNADWLSMTLIPDFEQVLGLPGAVDIRPDCLNPTSPLHVRARVTFREGMLAGGTPQYAYSGQSWRFPTGNPNYTSPFTDRLEWAATISQKSTITFQGVEFATGKIIKSIPLPASANDVVAQLVAQPVKPQANTSTIPHFDHYYDLLTYKGTARPIPNKIATSSCNPPFFTDEQRAFSERLLQIRSKFLPPMQDDYEEWQQDGCGASERAGSMFRSEPGICVSGIVYTDFK